MHLDVARRLAQAALPRFGVDPEARIEFVKYRENHVFRAVEPAGGSVAVRLHRPGYRDEEELRTELDYLRTLRDAGVLVPDVVPAADGALFAVVTVDGHERRVSVQRWMEGAEQFGDVESATLGTHTPDPGEFFRIGELLGRLHAAAERIGTPPGFRRSPWDADGLAGEAPLWGDPRKLSSLTAVERDAIDRALPALHARLRALPTDAAAFGVVHADATPENVLRTPDGLALIDFDDFGTGWYVFDLVTALHSHAAQPRYAEYERALLAGYRTVRDLTAEELAAWDWFLLARGLTYLGWAAERPGDPASDFISASVAPFVARAADLLSRGEPAPWRGTTPAPAPEGRPMAPADLLARRFATIGRHSPLFYDEPLHLVAGSGVWLTDSAGRRYLDAYNNVPHVGHAHPRVVEAMRAQAATLNIHTRYLNDRVVEYAETLLDRFEPELDRVFFANSGSEANELAFRIARQHTGATGTLVTDFSYHGNTSLLAGITTGLAAREGLAPFARAFSVPDLDAVANRDRPEAEVRDEALAAVDRAIDELVREGHGVAAVILESIFSTEGLVRVPAGFVEGVAARVRAAGGLVISDEVQAGLGRLGSTFWGYQRYDLIPDLVTMGKPLGNGHPLAAVVTTEALLEEFGSRNEFFNTFAGNPVSSAVGLEVLRIIDDEELVPRAARLGAQIRAELTALTAEHDRLGPVKGDGLFFGFSVFADDRGRTPDAATTKLLVEAVKARGVLLSRIGPTGSVLKIRPPLALQDEHLPLLLGTIRAAVGEALGTAGHR